MIEFVARRRIDKPGLLMPNRRDIPALSQRQARGLAQRANGCRDRRTAPILPIESTCRRGCRESKAARRRSPHTSVQLAMHRLSR